MALTSQYKKYNRSRRKANVETNFGSGMMFTEGAVNEGYVKTLVNFDFTTDGRNALKPRAGLRTSEFILPDFSLNSAEYLNENVAIKYSKEVVENGESFYQFILGKLDDNSETEGKIWVLTAPKSDKSIEGVSGDIAKVTGAIGDPSSSTAKYYSSSYAEIHGIRLSEACNTAFPVGSFFNNSFYYFNTQSKLCCTEYQPGTKNFTFNESISPKSITASEAVSFGYNMLSDTPYTFVNKHTTGVDTFQMEGILPYDSGASSSDRKLLMTPKKNSHIFFECYYDVSDAKSYVIKWSWKEVAADTWNLLSTASSWKSTDLPHIEVDFNPPSSEIMVRCEAYPIDNGTVSDTVEKAMVVGFDFTLDEDNSALNVDPENYVLSKATGMYFWKNRLVLWGVPEAPTTLFLSDYDEPTYFPYPNNISIFDEPIISVIELLDNLIVFTTKKIYQLSINAESGGFKTTVLQSNLYIDPWDKHLIQSVRNMLYFKSGNYYYMIVPKSQSTTGELTIAPITTPITDFFNRFSVNVSEVFKECFKTVVDGEVKTYIPDKLITYYNYLDYEFIHNIYVYAFDDSTYDRYVHFDIMYNVVNRYWKICVYEAPHLLYPFRNDATQQGLLASTSIVSVLDKGALAPVDNRIIQLFSHQSDNIEDLYFVHLDGYYLDHDTEHANASVTDSIASLPFADVSNGVATLPSSYVRLPVLKNAILDILGSDDYTNGFNASSIVDALDRAASSIRTNMLFKNKQYLDTGYRDSALFLNKRYRELQLQINNIDNVDMEFGMNFNIAGEPRNTDFLYEVSQTIDELTNEYGIAYIEATPYLYDEAAKIVKSNSWILEHSLDTDISLWKIRANISGKGAAPRLKLHTRNQVNYQLLGINWIFREMNMR